MKERIVKVMLVVVLALMVTGIFSVTIGGSPTPLSDRVDAVIMKGKSFPASMLGAPKGKYRLFAQQGANFAPIPFQIDEYDAKGMILMQKGPKAGADSDKGAFDANDELVFMAFDAAGKVSGKPSVSGCESFAEIAVTDAKKGATGYAYLAKCSSPPAVSSKKYISWNAAKNTAITGSYRWGWQVGGLRYYYDYLSIFGGPDVLDRLKVRIVVGFKGMNVKIKESNFADDIQGYLVGPVRIAYVNLSILNLGPVGKIPVYMYVYCYRDWMYLNNVIKTDFNPASAGLDYQVRIIHDLAVDRSRGYKVCTNVIPKCRDITGETTPEMLEIAKKKQYWGGLRGPEGTVITRLIMDPKLHTNSMAFYLDDDKAKRKPEYIPGSGPEMAFYVVDWKDAEDGMRYLDFYHYFMKKYSVAEVKRFSRITSDPLKVKASGM